MRHRPRSVVACGTALLAVAALAACSDGTDDADDRLVVYAAASLEPAFERLADDFEADHDGVEVTFEFQGSSDLVTQIQEGAPADVFASAATSNMDDLVEAGGASDPVDLATNTLEIAVQPGNPEGISGFADLVDDDLDVVVCAPDVPCGAATVEVEQDTDVDLSPASEESSVTDVLGKVSGGIADAGVVYVTDVLAAGDDVEGVAIPAEVNAVTDYPIAITTGAERVDLAEDWVALVTGPEGRRVLADAGFGPVAG